MSRLWRRLFAVSLIVALPLATVMYPPPVSAAGPLQCTIGFGILSLGEFNTSAGTFNADLAVWSLCPTDKYQVLKSLTFIQANSTRFSHFRSLPVNGGYWAQEEVSGTFRYNWDLGDYPFDRHTLVLRAEDSLLPIQSLVLRPDVTNSGLSNTLSVDGWKVTGFHIRSAPFQSNLTFGFPGYPPGKGSTASSLTVRIDITRVDTSSFFLRVMPVYVAFLLALASFFIPWENTKDRISMSATAVFTVVVSLASASGTLGSRIGFSLVGEIHILTLLFALGIAVNAVVARQLFLHGRSQATLARLDVPLFCGMVVSYVAINGLLVAIALHTH